MEHISLPWIEKYRPNNLDDIISHDYIIQTLDNFVKDNMIPHTLFYGPPGTGKTSTILAIARDLFGPELINERILEMNASDERSIHIIQDKIKTFSKISINKNIRNIYK